MPKKGQELKANRRFSEQIEQEIISRYVAGESCFVLCADYKCAKGTILNILCRNKIERRKAGEFPLRSNAKLYGFDRKILQDMVDKDMTAVEMGISLGIASSNIQNVCKHFGIRLKSQKQRAYERRNQISDDLFVAPLNSEQSWLLGLLLTDGCVYRNQYIKLSITDEDGVRFAHKILGFGTISQNPPGVHSKINGKAVQGKLPLWKCVTCSTSLAERLKLFGMVPRKTKFLEFPDPLKLSLSDFIRGLWDGDGGWGIDKRNGALLANFGVASQPFVEKLHFILKEITESKSNISLNSKGDFWKIQYYGKGAVSLAKWLYPNLDVVCLERKRRIIEPFLDF